MGSPTERKRITSRARFMLLPTVAVLIALSLASTPLVHAGNGFFYTAAQIGYDTNSSGLHVGIYGTSTQYPNNSPATGQSPQFYAGVEIRSRDPDQNSNGGTSAVYAVTNLHITVTGTDPSGLAISGQYFTPIQAWLSPQSTSTAQATMTFIMNALLNYLPYGIGTDIQYALPSGNGLSSGNPGNTAYADWTGALLNFDREHGLQLAFQMQIGSGLQGSYTLNVQYHVEVTTCSNPQLFPVGCSSTSTSSQDIYDTLYYCYVVCNPDVSVGDYSGSLSLTAGGTAVTDSIVVSANNYFSPPNPVSVSATSNDPSMGLSVNPQAVNLQRSRPDSPYANGFTTLTVTLPAGACKTGTFTITVVAQDNGLFASHGIPVTEPCEFSISASQPSPSSVAPGGSASSTITLNSQGLQGNIALSTTITPPPGTTCASIHCPTTSFTSNPVYVASSGSAPSTMTISTLNAWPGSYSIAVTGTSSYSTHSTTVNLTVQDLTLTASQTSVPADSTTTSILTVQLPSNTQGVTISFSTNLGSLSSGTCVTGSTGSCSLTITSSLTGQATITATTANYPSHQVTVTFTGSLTASSNTSILPATISVQTSNKQANVIVSLTTTLGSLSASSCTTGTTGSCSVTITSATAGSATVTATASYYYAGTTTLTVPSLSLSANPSSVPADSTTTSTITAQTSNNLQGVTISFTTTGGALSASSCTTGSAASCSITIKSNQAVTVTVTATAQYYAAGQTNVAFFDFAITTSPLSIDGTNGAFCNSSNNICSTAITTQNQNDIIVAYTLDSLDTRTGCNFGIGDSAGLAWNLRMVVQGRNDGTTFGYRDQIAEFWARSPAKLSSDIISEGVFCSVSGYGGELDGLIVFGINGANYNSPFDSNPGWGAAYSNTPAATISTYNPNDLIISGVLQSGYYSTLLGPAYGFNTIDSTVGSCYSTYSATGTLVAAGSEYGFSGSPLTNFPVRFSDCAPGWWEQIADAILPAPSPAVNVGTSVGSSIILSSLNGFSGTVSLTDTVPPGVTCSAISLSSLNVGPYYPSVATISCASSTGGNYPVTITATSGTLTHYATIHVIENDFSLSASTNAINVVANLQAIATITINGPTGVTPTISLSTIVSPSTGLTCSLNPASITLSGSGPSTSTLSCSGSVGTYTVTVTGSSNGLIRSTPVTVTVQDFSMQISNNQLIVNAGSTGSLTLTVTSLNNYAGTISFTSSAPWCLYYNFNPASVGLNAGGSSTTTFSISPVGACSGAQYSITITASGPGGAIHSLPPITATVPGYTVSVSPYSQTIPAARSGSYTVTVTSVYGYSGTIAFSIPTGALTACAGSSFQPTTLSLASGGAGSTTLTISPSGSCPASYTYPYFYAQDSAKGIIQSASVNLIISTFQVSMNYPTIGTAPGATAYYTVTVTSLNNYPSASIYLGFAGYPPCLSMLSWNNQLNLPSGGSVSTQIAYTSTSNCTSPQSFTITNVAQDNAYPSVTASASIGVTVGYFSMAAAQATLTVYLGSSGSDQITIYPYYGSSDTLSLTTSGVPACATASFSPSTINLPNGGTTTITISAASTCTTGSYAFTVTAQGPTIGHSFGLTLVISNPPPCCGGGGGGSVAYGSLITLADGSRIPVQDLKVGAVMLGYDPTTGQFVTSTVLSIATVQTTNMLIIHTRSGAPFRVDANPKQTLWVKTLDGKTGWMPVTQIQPGDYLLTPTGWTMVTSIEFAPAGNHTMFDIVATMPYFTDNYLDPIYKT